MTTNETLTKLQKESLIYIKEGGDIPKNHGNNSRLLVKKGLITYKDDWVNMTMRVSLTDLGNSIYFQI